MKYILTIIFDNCADTRLFGSFQGVYNVKRNPRYLNGEATEEEILSKFLNNFETTGIKDGMVRILFT